MNTHSLLFTKRLNSYLLYLSDKYKNNFAAIKAKVRERYKIAFSDDAICED
jgi:hypothetical protein